MEDSARVAAEITGHLRYLELCDPEHPHYNPAYLSIVREIAKTGKASNCVGCGPAELSMPTTGPSTPVTESES
jgi:hypothetical protein